MPCSTCNACVLPGLVNSFTTHWRVIPDSADGHGRWCFAPQRNVERRGRYKIVHNLHVLSKISGQEHGHRSGLRLSSQRTGTPSSVVSDGIFATANCFEWSRDTGSDDGLSAFQIMGGILQDRLIRTFN
jgi:hypothetical protein